MFHPKLTKEKWHVLSRDRQILNIASELNRTRHALERGEKENVEHSLDRALELLDLTIIDVTLSVGARRELLRFRECLGGWYVGIETSAEKLQHLIRVLIQLDPRSAEVVI